MHLVEVVEVNLSAGEVVPTCAQKGSFTIVYLAGHGSFRAFGDTEQVEWSQFAKTLCNSACLEPSSTVFAACCEGGMKNVAIAVFKECPKVGYVIGPKSLVTQQTLAFAFHCFLYNVAFRKGGVDLAVEFMCSSSGHIFLSHDLPSTYLENQATKLAKLENQP
jgi:hypothetical protein